MQSRLVDNALFTDYKGALNNSYLYIYNNYKYPNVEIFTRNFFELSKNQPVISLNFGMNIDRYNTVSISLESFFRKQFWYNHTDTLFGQNSSATASEWSDGLLDFNYFRNLYFGKKKRMIFKIGLGIGIALDLKSDYTTIFDKTLFTNDLYLNSTSFTYKNNNTTVIANELYRNLFYVSISPKVQIEFMKTQKHSFNLNGGMHIVPYSSSGVEAWLIDRNTEKTMNRLVMNFYNVNIYFGIGYTFGWKKHYPEENTQPINPTKRYSFESDSK